MQGVRFARRSALRASLAASIAAAAVAPVRARTGASVRTAALAGAAAGAALELPAVGAAVAVAAAVDTARRRHRSATALTVSAVAGVAAALATRRAWPVAPRTAAQIRPALTPVGSEPAPDGNGLTVIVNPSAGPALRSSPTEQLREELPRATVIEAGDERELAAALDRARSSAKAIAVAGGDGTINAVAAVAHGVSKPLLVIPSGTLNHLARDLGINGVDDAIAALRDGHTVAVDVAEIDGHTFLNTASFGAYSELVDARERLEETIGKWPALVVALAQVLRRDPVDVELDGVRRTIWMIFIGNCSYHPAGFAPSWRERLDDGVLDVRVVDAGQPWARLRLLAAVLTGRLGRSGCYEAFTTRSLHVRSNQGPLRLARDGETFDGSEEFTVCKADRPLAVYVAAPDDDSPLPSLRSHRPKSTSKPNSTTTPKPVSQGPASL